MKQGKFRDLGMGLGLRSRHFNDVINGQARVSWFEALTENYMDESGRSLALLEKVRQTYPVALHGVSLSIASVDPLNHEYLSRLKNLIDRIEPAIVSDHLCWTGINQKNLHDLMPVPFTGESVRHIVARVREVQDRIGRRILLENLSSYISFKHSEMTEWEFVTEVTEQADCGILLDVNNVYVNSINHGFDPFDYIRGIPLSRVGQIHLAGHSRREKGDGKVILVDTHDAPVCDEVWSLYSETVRIAGNVSTMVEWDANIPELNLLETEIFKAMNYRSSAEREVLLGAE